jgi:hypothetical protein
MKSLIIIISILIMNSCSSVKNNKIAMKAKETDKDKVILNFKAGPPTIIYKTKKDYNKFVPVILSEDKSKIVSYPHPTDILVNDKFSYPTQLEKGYLLDNRGINKNAAFLNMTYEEYSKLETAPLLEKLFSMIVDNDPLIEIYNCGNRYTFKNEISDLNKLINNNELMRCKCLTK